MSISTRNAEVLLFRRGDTSATIATNGHRHMTQDGASVREHETLTRAISYLESQGFNIVIDTFKSY